MLVIVNTMTVIVNTIAVIVNTMTVIVNTIAVYYPLPHLRVWWGGRPSAPPGTPYTTPRNGRGGSSHGPAAVRGPLVTDSSGG